LVQTSSPPSRPTRDNQSNTKGACEANAKASPEVLLYPMLRNVLRFPNCAFVGLAKSRIAALSKPPEAPANPFDGIWIIKEVCERKAPNWSADNFQFAARIKDGIFHTQYGEMGKPGSINYDGTIERDGSAEIAVHGFTGDPDTDPLHRATGSEVHYKLAIKLEGSRGAGVRTGTPRPCHLELSRLSATSTAATASGEVSPDVSLPDGEGGRASRAEKSAKDPMPAEAKRAKPDGKNKHDHTLAVVEPDRREIAAPNRGVNGLSCTKMLGKCGAVCAANTGRPDCASTVCVHLHQQCLSSGCWRGRAFSSCGLVKQ
jgi:hypothetical protein